MTTLPLAELVEDFTIYPRHAVDDANVAGLVNALKAGAALPPLVVDRQSKRIVDGWHRARAYRRVIGPQAVVNVEIIPYPTEVAMLEDAIRRNAAHGRKLDVIDQVRVVTLCQERGVTVTQIAALLNVLPERVEKLAVRLAFAAAPGDGTIPGTVAVALKRPVAHLAGTTMTEAQVEAHTHAPGTSYLLIAQQLTVAIQHDFINRDDARLMGALALLWDGLGSFLNPPAG